MLLKYSAQNFHCFAEKVEVSFLLTQRDVAPGWNRVSPSGQRVTTVIAVLGANGAGKTTLAKIGPFIAWFIRDSFTLTPDAKVPCMPHPTMGNEPSMFEIEGDDEEASWRYSLTVRPTRVIHESLRRKGRASGARWTPSFTRDWNENTQAYDVKQYGFGLADTEAAKVRQNVSFISWAKQYGVATAIEVSDFYVSTNVTTGGLAVQTDANLWDAAAYFSESAELYDQMRLLLRGWDLGLSDVRLHKVEPMSPEAETARRWYPMGVHSARGQRFELPFGLESSGTKAAFVLLWRLLPVLRTGGVAFIDELESHLHPHMIEPILRLFHEPTTNPRNAQLVFTCQSPEVLRLLHRAQVMFVEKVDCESAAYRGDSIAGLNSSHNLFAKYNAGALGAVPQF
ncbi:AAA family ATPase [Rivibacter subsaxonicus]|uniref:ATPase AAA-type core domain-containing protein n=1 Tax=Rivibacter subsaxonicus TaxID=457575 RepID=A0A4Q7VCW7_9BURK|nr:ATP-binding protein [Rivibacter subsaxonicus]RZT93727.1 hypothetical protein EV670_3280 [Rivibacter subsaxonicus]